ncbi:MAG: HlyD family efflux transporter periplasmic adaptor subunit [Herminiimonas sp.]|nr:HlyD family efflux transporter periplasmic adaptor subunit [Herminiimonas sp.]
MPNIKTLLLFAGWTAASLLTGCGEKSGEIYSGYAEGDYVRLASPITGTLAKLYVKRGEKVTRNAPAFALEQASERAGREEANFRVEHARSQLANLSKSKRPDEIAAAQAQLAQAEAASRSSQRDFARQKELVAAKFVSPARLDESRSAADRDRARVAELSAQLRVARLGARTDEIAAAEQDVKTAQAQLAQADWKLDQKSQNIPVAAYVADVLYREGELVPAGSPVISLLPPENIKVRFFVPETVLGTMALGADIVLTCDNCGAPIPATVSYIAAEAEYTSPLIYSKENRSTLVFMIEARPSVENARRLHPGQPLEIRLAKTVDASRTKQ